MGKANGEQEKKDTRRVVLQQHRVLVLPDGVESVDEKKLRDALGLKGSTPKLVTGEAWMVVGEFVGDSKDRAIEAFAGKPGTDSAKVGVFKAPTVTAWAGGAKYSAPPKPLVEKEAID